MRPPMTTIGNSVPPGAFEPNASVVIRYFPASRASIVASVSVRGAMSFSTMASPPHMRSGKAKAQTPARTNGTASFHWAARPPSRL